ncbi:MAG: acyltransferase, partial [Acidimicrobiales bacterium]|nr:acyltransferase [Acidimicrobiales bacterium]
ALVRRAARRRDRLRTELVAAGALMVVGTVALWLQHMDPLPLVLAVLLPHLTALGGGVLLAVVAAGRADRPRLERWARRCPPPAVCWPLGILAIMWTPGRAMSMSDTTTSWTVLAFAQVAGGLLLAAPVMLGAGSGGAVSRGLRSRLLVATGIVSYGVYLWHYDILGDLEVAPLDQGVWQAFAALAVLLMVSVGAGLLSYRVVERPALAWARRRGSARP